MLIVLGILGVLAVIGSLADDEEAPRRFVAQSRATGEAIGTNSPAPPGTRRAMAATMVARWTPTPTPVPGTEGNPAAVGTTLEGDGEAVTVTSVRFLSEFGYSTPKGSYQFLVLNVRIENVGNEDERYSRSDFSGQDARTKAGFDSVWVANDQLLDSGTLSPQEYVTGIVVLEVQETVERVLVKYDPAMFDPDDLYWVV